MSLKDPPHGMKANECFAYHPKRCKGIHFLSFPQRTLQLLVLNNHSKQIRL
nr:MAG TPA: hypothetical protein [Caudoviricetes sp.]